MSNPNGGGLDRLSSGAKRWISRNLRYLDPAEPGLADTPKVKASLELALLCRIWRRLRPEDEELAIATETLRRIWRHPQFPRLMAATPRYFRIHALHYLALAPPGLTGGHEHTLREQIAPEGRFPLYGKSARVRLEARYYAEMAGLAHEFAPYEQLYGQCLLTAWTATPTPVDPADAYAVTHILYHLSDFGARDPGLPAAERDRVSGVLDELMTWFTAIGHWDLMAELLLAQCVIGTDPARTESGAAAIGELLAAQETSGAVPAWLADKRPAESAPEFEIFQKAYHTTLVTAMAAMVVSAAHGR